MNRGLFLIGCVLVSACADEDPTFPPPQAQVIQVQVSPDTVTIDFGQTTQFQATVIVKPGVVDANRPVTWSSSDTMVATVDGQGQALGRFGGAAGIFASAGAVRGIGRLIVLGRVRTVQLSPASLELLTGDTARVTLIARDTAGNLITNRPVSWLSSDENVATVSATGLVTAVGKGTATVSATIEGLTANASVGVILPIVFVQLDVGRNHSCGVGVDSTAFCWGAGGSGQLGRLVPSQDVPRSIVSPQPLKLLQVSAGDAHTCALAAGGAAWCWGDDSSGQVGGPAVLPEQPVRVVGGLSFAAVTAGGAHSCGLTTSDAAYCWGRNDRGQVGDSTNTNRSVPAAVVGSLSFAQLSAGGSHTCGITAGGQAYCWGRNDRGQVGDSTNVDRIGPAPVVGSHTFVSVSAGDAHSCGVTVAGEALCWGSNSQGQLGDASAADRVAPTAVIGGLTFSSVSAGLTHTCGAVVGETAYCWGANASGQLGEGSVTPSMQPRRVAGAEVFVKVTAGGSHTCAATGSPLVFCWGRGVAGQLGSGAVANPPGFVNVPLLVSRQQ